MPLTDHLTSGLADDFTGTIKDAHFGINPSYMAGEAVLYIVDFVDVEGDTDETVIADQQWKLPEGWEPTNKGLAIEHNEGKTRIHKNSQYGQLVARIAELSAQHPDLAKHFIGNDDPTNAQTFEGLRFHWKREVQFAGTDYQRELLLPVAFVETQKKIRKGKVSSRKVSSEVVAQIRAIAEDAEDEDEFIERCYSEIDGIDNDPEIQKLVDDTESATSIWVTVNS